MHRFLLKSLKNLWIKETFPLGIFAVNDGIAVNILESEGMIIGKDIGIVIDNNPETQYLHTLTTVAQNGY